MGEGGGQSWVKISNIIRRGRKEEGGGHSFLKSLIKLEREDPMKEGWKRKYNYIKIREDEKLKTQSQD